MSEGSNHAGLCDDGAWRWGAPMDYSRYWHVALRPDGRGGLYLFIDGSNMATVTADDLAKMGVAVKDDGAEADEADHGDTQTA